MPFRSLLNGSPLPWHVRTADVPIDFALGKRISGDVEARKVSSLHKEPQRWLCSTKFRCSGCDSRHHLILNMTGDILMGVLPDIRIDQGEAAAIPTGGSFLMGPMLL